MMAQLTRSGRFGEYYFRVERDRDGLYWEFEHDTMWAACDSEGVKAAAIEGIGIVVQRLRRWADELEKEMNAIDFTRPTVSDG